MNTLLLFFALPIAVIIISIALQKIFHNPFLVAAIIFAIFLVITFLVTDTMTFLISTIIYTIIAYITAVLTQITCKILRNLGENNNNNNDNGDCERMDTETIDITSSIYPNNIDGKTNNYYRNCRRV